MPKARGRAVRGAATELAHADDGARQRSTATEHLVKHLSQRLHHTLMTNTTTTAPDVAPEPARMTQSLAHSAAASAQEQPPPPLPCATISRYLQDAVREVVAQMRSPHSAHDTARHVLLTSELLHGDAAWGFTPSMMLAGMDDMLELFTDALLQGKHLTPPPELFCTSAEATVWETSGPDTTDAVPARRTSCWAHSFTTDQTRRAGTRDAPVRATEPSHTNTSVPPTVPVEGFLPPLVPHVETMAREVYKAFCASATRPTESAGAGVNEAVLPRLGSRPTGTAKQCESAVVPGLRTVPEALHALLLHCAQPLSCLTLEDQQCVPVVIGRLCGSLSRLLTRVQVEALVRRGDDAAPQTCVGDLSYDACVAMTRAIRLAALRALASLLQPSSSNSAGVDDAATTAALEGVSEQLVTALCAHWDKLLDAPVTHDVVVVHMQDDASSEDDNDGTTTSVDEGAGQELHLVLTVLDQLCTRARQTASSTTTGGTTLTSCVVHGVPTRALRGLTPQYGDAVAVPHARAVASLCVDLLWRCIRLDPSGTARRVLYDTSTDARTAMTDAFEVVVRQLNASHTAWHREVRNDMVLWLTLVLRHGVDCPDPPPLSTLDALNGIALVLFDLACGAELDALAPQTSTTTTGECADGGVHTLLARRARREYALRYFALAAPAVRKDNVQFKCVAWQLLEAFCEWQAHARHSARNWDVDRVIAALDVVDLASLGLIEVWVCYVDTTCRCVPVVSWTRDELLTLETEAWQLLTALLTCQDNLLARLDHTAATADLARLDADRHFLDADGLRVLLRYVHEAPDNVEPLKRRALTVLATLTRLVARRARTADVARVLQHGAALVSLLLRLLGPEGETLEQSKWDAHAVASRLRCTHPASTLVTQSLHTLAHLAQLAAQPCDEVADLNSGPEVLHLLLDQGVVPCMLWWWKELRRTWSKAAHTGAVQRELCDTANVFLALLELLRRTTLIPAVPTALEQFVRHDGVAVLLDLVEVLLPHALPDGAVLAATRASAHNDAVAAVAECAARDRARGAVGQLLTVLADVLHDEHTRDECAAGCKAAFLEWRSTRYVDDSGSLGLNAVQLLLLLWNAYTTAPATKTDTARPGSARAEVMDPNRAFSVAYKRLHEGIQSRVHILLREDYVRRLLRRKAALDDPVTDPAVLVQYYRYIYRTPDVDEAAVWAAMQTLQDASEEGVYVQHVHSLQARLRLCFDTLGLKVYSCLAALGFDAVYETDVTHTSTAAAGADLSLSAQDRAQLMLIAALPMLCEEEIHLAITKAVGALDADVMTPCDDQDDLALRPATPDVKCLRAMYAEAQARATQLAQLTALHTQLHATQTETSYERFLVSRLRQPVGSEGRRGGTHTTQPVELAASLAERCVRQQNTWPETMLRTTRAEGTAWNTTLAAMTVHDGRAAAWDCTATCTVPLHESVGAREDGAAPHNVVPFTTEPVARPRRPLMELRAKKLHMLQNSLKALPPLEVEKEEH